MQRKESYEHPMNTIEKKGPWLIIRARLTGPFVKLGKSPNKLHQTLPEAFAEAVKLAKEQPGFTFSVFECIGQVSEEKPLEVVAEAI